MVYLKTIFAVRDERLPPWLDKKMAEVLKEQNGRKVVITLETEKKHRSNNQNSFYWGIVLPLIYSMFRDAGNNVTKEEVHEYLKRHVGKMVKEIHDPNGEIQTVVASSSSVSTMAFEDWLTKIRAWAAEFGVMVPFPNELTFVEGEQL